MSDNEVKVTIYDENIPPFWLKKIQKLKKEIVKFKRVQKAPIDGIDT